MGRREAAGAWEAPGNSLGRREAAGAWEVPGNSLGRREAAGAWEVPGQDHQDTQDTQEGVAGAKRGPLAGHLQARSGSHSWPCRILAVLGVLGVLAARHPMKFLAGGPATGKRHSLRAAQPLSVGTAP